MRHRPTRREILAVGAATLLPGPKFASREEVLRFRLEETAGLRRFGYPVHLLLPETIQGEAFRLERDGKPIPAQFRTIAEPSGPAGRVALDFASSLGPLEHEDYLIRFGAGVEPGPGNEGAGMMVERTGDGQVVVAHGPNLKFTLRDDLKGFLQAVGGPRLSYVDRDSAGLLVRLAGGEWKPLTELTAEPIRLEVQRSGPWTVALVYRGRLRTGAESTAPWELTLIFPRTKSWVEAHFVVDDARQVVDSLGVEIDLTVEGEPTLVDFGAKNTVYGTLKSRERMELAPARPLGPGRGPSGPLWTITKVTEERSLPFAVAGGMAAQPAEGWAHVMDRQRCTAAALADFGLGGVDRITVSDEGRLRITRSLAELRSVGYAPPRSACTFWLHFVSMPVQIGAATSPQAMLAPLRVFWM